MNARNWNHRSPSLGFANRGTQLVAAGALSAAALFGSPAADASAPNVWYAGRSLEAKNNWLIADDNCAHGAEDCNRCADNVQGQWNDMAAGALAWLERSWHFGWDRGPAPSGIKPEQAWDVGGFDFDSHAQGFVRTNHPTVKYAMSHNDDTYGSLTFINNTNNIHALHRTTSEHPSGIFTFGRYVGMMDGSSSVRFFDTTRSLESHDLHFALSAAHGPATLSGNGGLAMAKLYGGGYLLVVGQGGIDTAPQSTYLYFVDGPLTAPNRIQHLQTNRPPPTETHNQSENISIITECGTRDIYTVHMMGDNVGGQGYYALNKVVWGTNGPWLQRVNVKIVNSDISYCHHRSAASASVRDNGYIDLYCHERAEDNGILSGPGDDWDFREGLNYHNW